MRFFIEGNTHDTDVRRATATDGPLHVHNNVEIIYMHSGEFWAEIGNEQHLLKEGDLLFVLPLEVHGFKATANGGVYSCIAINASKISGYGFSVFNFAAKKHMLPKDRIEARTQNLLDLLLKTPYDCDHNVEIRTALSVALFGELLHQFEFAPKIDTYGEKRENIISCCLDNYLDPEFSINKLSAMVGVSTRTLSRFFSSEMGIGFIKFINRLRLEKATERLKGGGTVIEAAMDSGFGSVRSFNRNFYNEFKISPSDFVKIG